jgi:hypothetical protein
MTQSHAPRLETASLNPLDTRIRRRTRSVRSALFLINQVELVASHFSGNFSEIEQILDEGRRNYADKCNTCRIGRRPFRAAPWLKLLLLPFVCLDHFFDLGLDGRQVEGSWILHWRIVDSGQGQLAHSLLNNDEAPELARIKVIHVAPTHVI